jgi:hypothetical protein
MLISHKKRFIYTKTAKTAGTSVESYFEKFCMPEGTWKFSEAREVHVSKEGIIGYRGNNPEGKQWRHHMSAIGIKKRIGDDIWNSYFKFCVIRNPFDKLISAFFFFEKKNRLVTNETRAISSIRDEDDIDRFRNWLRNEKLVNNFFDRDKYVIQNKIAVDFFIKYEELEDGIEYVCNRLNLPFEPERLPRLKSGSRTSKAPIGAFYDEESIQIVNRLFGFELELFGYRIPK